MRTYFDTCMSDVRMLRRGRYSHAGLLFVALILLDGVLAWLRGWAIHAHHGGPFRFRDSIW